MTVEEYKKDLAAYIRKCIDLRMDWACSPDGYQSLGPGSPTVPGLQEYFQILAYVEGREYPDR